MTAFWMYEADIPNLESSSTVVRTRLPILIIRIGLLDPETSEKWYQSAVPSWLFAICLFATISSVA
jgi:hypothetical protein